MGFWWEGETLETLVLLATRVFFLFFATMAFSIFSEQLG
jgi:hypothetical protein